MSDARISTEALASLPARLLAYALDAAIVSVPLAIVVLSSTLDPVVVILLSQSVYFLYFVIQWSRIGSGRTLGMRALGIRVVRADGRGIGLGRGATRYATLVLGQALLGLGVLWALGDTRHQGWHDKVAGTLVVRDARAASQRSD
jgi:uncharacterized RDD family membrane protein YckC